MEEDLRLLEVGVHSVRLAAQHGLEEHLGDEHVHDHEHEGVGGGDREGGGTRGQGHQDAGREHKEEGGKDNELGVHFYTKRRENLWEAVLSKQFKDGRD